MVWRRRGTDAEAKAEEARLIARLVEINDRTRQGLQDHIEQVREQREAATDKGIPTGPFDVEIASAEAALEQIEDPRPQLTPPVVQVAVEACDEHAVSGDAGAVLHERDCFSDGACDCAL